MKWFYAEGIDGHGRYHRYTTWPGSVAADEIDGMTLKQALKVIGEMYEGEPVVVKGRGTTIIVREAER